MSRRNSQQYYYTEPYFQLELNLHAIRLALIYLLEEFEAEECFICNKLQCRCRKSLSTIRSSISSDLGYSFSEVSSVTSLATEQDYVFFSAPAAHTLPRPVWRNAFAYRTSSPDLDLEEYFRDILQWALAATYADPDNLFQINEAINNDINSSWPPGPTSIWYYTPEGVKAPSFPQEMRQTITRPVEQFFKQFDEVVAANHIDFTHI